MSRQVPAIIPTQTASIIVGFILLFGFCARGATYKIPLLDRHAWRQAEVELRRSIGTVSSPSERVVVLGTSDPKLLFCMDRKGWVMPSTNDDGALRTAWQAGARLVVVPKTLPHESVRRFLDDNGTTVLSTTETDLIRLR